MAKVRKGHMLDCESVLRMIVVVSIGCVRAADQGNVDFGARIQVVILVSICVLLSLLDCLLLTDVTNVKLAILLKVIAVGATVVRNH